MIKKTERKEIVLASKKRDMINRYIIDMSKYIPEKVRASAKWQADSSKVLQALGIGVNGL